MFSKMNLKSRIILGFIVVSAFSIIVGLSSYYFLGQVISKYDHIVKSNLANLTALSDMLDDVRVIRTRVSILGLKKNSEADVKEAYERIAKVIEEYEQNDKKYNSISFVAGEEVLYTPINEGWKKSKKIVLELLDLYKKEGANDKFFSKFYNEYIVTNTSYLNNMAKLMDFQNSEAKKWSTDAAEMGALASKVSAIIIVSSLILSLLLAMLIAKTLTSQLAKVIFDLNAGAPQLGQAANNMSSVSTQLSSSASEQAAAVQETASSLEEISAMIRKNRDSATNATSISIESLSSVNEGQGAVEDMLAAMGDINQNNTSFNSFIQKNNEELGEIVQVIKEIADKTKVINDIVFQTKLLSFNASVEAARAGEQGKGFSVVAEEVGNLAAMSGTAANQISEMLSKSIQKVDQIVVATKSQVEVLVKDGKEKIEKGVNRAEKCKQSLDKIHTSVSNVSSLVTEISNASNEQTQGIEEVNKAMGQIDEVTNQNTAASQNVSSNAEQVTDLVHSMTTTIGQLVQLLEGTGGSTKTSTTASSSPTSSTKKTPPQLTLLKEEKSSERSRVSSTKSNKAPMKKADSLDNDKGIPKKVAVGGNLPSHDDDRFQDV